MFGIISNFTPNSLSFAWEISSSALKAKALLVTAVACTILSRSRLSAITIGAVYGLYNLCAKSEAQRLKLEDSAEQDSHARETAYRKDNDTHQTQREKLQETNTTQRQEITALQHELSEEQTRRRSDTLESEKMLNQGYQTIHSLNDQVSDLEMRTSEQQREIDALVTNFEQANRSITKLTLQNTNQQGTINDLNVSLMHANQQHEIQQQQLQSAQNQIGSLQHNLTHANNQLHQTASALTTARDTIRVFRNANSQLGNCVMSQMETLERVGSELQALETRLNTPKLSSTAYGRVRQITKTVGAPNPQEDFQKVFDEAQNRTEVPRDLFSSIKKLISEQAIPLAVSTLKNIVPFAQCNL